MSRHSGRYRKGYRTRVRELKRLDAADRNARTPEDRRRAAREGSVAYRATTPVRSTPQGSGGR